MEFSVKRRPGTSAGIFTASMADVVVLVIVFFALTHAVPRTISG